MKIKALIAIFVMIVLVFTVGNIFRGQSDLKEMHVNHSIALETEESKENVEVPITHQSSVVRSYFISVANENMEAFLDNFSQDAVLRVVSRDLKMEGGIERFAKNEVFGGKYEVYRAEIREDGIKILLRFTPKGWTNPEPMAVYDFTIKNHKIVNANLQYATKEDKAYFEDKYLEESPILSYGFKQYLAGVLKDDVDVFMTGFTHNASVIDVGRMIEGQDEISTWANREVLSLDYHVGKIIFHQDGEEMINQISLSPNTSGFYASYHLKLKDDLIDFADLQYASQEDFSYE